MGYTFRMFKYNIKLDENKYKHLRESRFCAFYITDHSVKVDTKTKELKIYLSLDNIQENSNVTVEEFKDILWTLKRRERIGYNPDNATDIEYKIASTIDKEMKKIFTDINQQCKIRFKYNKLLD